MGKKIEDYYKELDIPFKSHTTHLLCGIVVKKDGRVTFLLTKNKKIINLIVPSACRVGDTLHLLVVDNTTKQISEENYKKAKALLHEIDDIPAKQKINVGIITKKITKKQKQIDISW